MNKNYSLPLNKFRKRKPCLEETRPRVDIASFLLNRRKVGFEQIPIEMSRKVLFTKIFVNIHLI